MRYLIRTSLLCSITLFCVAVPRAAFCQIDVKQKIELLDRYGFQLGHYRNFEASRKTYGEAIDLANKTYGPNSPTEAHLYTWLAQSVSDSGDNEKALECFEYARKIYASKGSNLPLFDTYEYAQSLRMYADTFKKLNKYDRADALAQESKMISNLLPPDTEKNYLISIRRPYGITVPCCFAMCDIPAGQIIERDMVFDWMIQKTSYPSGAIDHASVVIGKKALKPIKRFSPITQICVFQ